MNQIMQTLQDFNDQTLISLFSTAESYRCPVDAEPFEKTEVSLMH